MADPVIVVAVITPAEGEQDAVRDALLAVVPKVHTEEGCERYALHQRADGAFVMLERWTSAELLQQHSAGANLVELGAALEGRLAAPTDVTAVRSLPAGDPAKGVL